MGIAAIHRSVIDTALYHPSASRAVVLVSDNPACEPVRISAGKLSPHKCLIQQEGQVLS